MNYYCRLKDDFEAEKPGKWEELMKRNEEEKVEKLRRMRKMKRIKRKSQLLAAKNKESVDVHVEEKEVVFQAVANPKINVQPINKPAQQVFKLVRNGPGFQLLPFNSS